MAKKRSRKRSRGNKFEAVRSPALLKGATWNDLEQGFFASAPPDDPEPPPEAPRFDDLFPAAPRRGAMPRATRLLAAISAAGWSRRRIAIALTSLGLLICVFAVVLVFGRQTRPKSPVDPTPPASSSGAGNSSPPSASSPRRVGAAYGS
jgi:hypothetical protein